MLNLKNKILRDGKSQYLQFRLGKSQARSRGLGSHLMKNLVELNFMMDNLLFDISTSQHFSSSSQGRFCKGN